MSAPELMRCAGCGDTIALDAPGETLGEWWIEHGECLRRLAEKRTLASLLDVVQELAQGLAAGQTPMSEWAQIVADTFDKHRAELRGEEVEWESEG